MSYRRKRTNTILDEEVESERSETSTESHSISPRPIHAIQPKGKIPTPTSTKKHNRILANSVNAYMEDRPYKTPRSSRIPSQLQPPPFRSSEEHGSSHLPSKKRFQYRQFSSQNGGLAVCSTSAPEMDVHIDTPIREANSEPLEQENEQVKSASKPSRSLSIKSKPLALNWPDRLDFDEKEEVLIIDAEGKHLLLSGRLQPHDIDNLDIGVRCVVQFNEFNQPIRKGGSVLVKYLGSLAKDKRFCPIGEKSWHLIDKQYKAKIIQVVRSKFIIPEGEAFNRAILMRISKNWRYYKHSLKKMKFDPESRTKEQILNDVPHGQTRDSWIHLVEYWYTKESQKLSECGKKARSSRSHVHTTGSKSYANKRADFVESKGRQPSHLEFFELTHTQTEGGSVDNTISSQFLAEANAKVQEFVNNASPSKSLVEIENDVFHRLMYEEGQPKKPVGFGLGVKESDVFGVHSLLRKTSHNSTIGTNSAMEVENLKATIANMKKENQATLLEMKKENQELRARIDHTNQILLQALTAIRTGVVSSEFLDAVESTLRVIDSKAASASSGNMTCNDLADSFSTNPPSRPTRQAGTFAKNLQLLEGNCFIHS